MKSQPTVTVGDLVDVLKQVSGLTEYQAKLCIYCGMATHHLKRWTWFPMLAVIGPPGTGKSRILDMMALLCYKPYRINLDGISTATLTEKLASASYGTALLEEGDKHPNKKVLEGLLMSRVDRNRTSTLSKKVHLTEAQRQAKNLPQWLTIEQEIYGASVLHDRNALADLAAESRALVINTRWQPGPFVEPPKKLELPAITLGKVPDYFTQSGRAFDTWRPLIEVATGQGDDDWLLWVLSQIEEATNDLKNGHMYEEGLTIFRAVVAHYCNSTGTGLLVKEPVNLKTLADSLRGTSPWINEKTIGTHLRKMGFDVHIHGGMTKLFTKVDKLRSVANDIGYQDAVL